MVDVQGREQQAYDLLVCAEGISSSSRRMLLPRVGPVYSGYVGWRGTVDPATLSSATRRSLDDLIVYAVPPYNQVLCYPIPGAVEDRGVNRSGFNWVWYRERREGAAAHSGHDRPRWYRARAVAGPGHGT